MKPGRSRGCRLVGLLIASLIASCARAPTAVRDTVAVRAPTAAGVPAAGIEGVPYTGLLVEDGDAGGARIVALEAGPAAQAGLATGDIIRRCDGVTIDATRLRERLADARPGEPLQLEIVRAGGIGIVELVPALRRAWQGPAAFPARLDAGTAESKHPRDPFARLIASLQPAPSGLEAQNAALVAHFARLARDTAGYHKSSAIREALTHPDAFADRSQRYGEQLRQGGPLRARIVPVFCAALALDCPAGISSAAPTAVALAALERETLAAYARVPGARAGLDGNALYLAGITATGQLLFAQPQATRGIGAMRASMSLDRAALLAAFAGLLDLAERMPTALTAVTPAAPAPEALRAKVEGGISAWARTTSGFIVAGDNGSNRYDMAGLVAVFDSGGDDRYVWNDTLAPAVQLVVDAAGNDRYQSNRGGPGSGWLGIGVLVDRAGDDRYRAVLGGCGAGVFGFGALVDSGGNDAYHCDAWALGAGLYGGGIAVDDGPGGDLYLSQILSQGAGGPGGVGTLIDGGGDDLYRANGLVDSAYDTPAVFMGLSQGVGYGFRPHDHGGVGMLYDSAGNDRYEGGEFSQGGGYFWGVGMLDDSGGDDLYYGNRYAQAYAAHQAAGLLVDAGGDDVYWSMTAAAQAAAWDESLALLIDHAGDDIYRAATLSQGAAANQSRALFRDLAGDDTYRAATPAAQGAAGDNDYHWNAHDPVTSLGVLFDGAGADDYSRGLRRGEVRVDSGSAPMGSGVAGLAVDRACGVGSRTFAEGTATALSIEAGGLPEHAPFPVSCADAAASRQRAGRQRNAD